VQFVIKNNHYLFWLKVLQKAINCVC